MHVRSTRRSIARVVSTFTLAIVLSMSGLLSVPPDIAARAWSPRGTGWLSLASGLASFAPLRPLAEALAGSQAVNWGRDGRLTVLLLGSDTRSGGVARTDTIMIMSLKGGKINAASIPRDTAKILNPFTAAPNDTFTGRVNAILKKLKQGATVQQALAKFEIVIEHLLGIEIDYHALLTFNGFQALVDEVDPISIKITREIADPKFWDDPNKIKGAYFPAAPNGYLLYANQPGTNPLCNGLWRNQSKPIPSQYWCRKALPFVRSRKGKGNSDFVRARRQQDFVAAALRRVIARGNGAALTSLRGVANSQSGAGRLYTNIPFNTDALALFNALKSATLGNQVVFSPTTYATRIPGTSAYQLKLPAVRSWAASNLR